jgi:hypothetical protein
MAMKPAQRSHIALGAAASAADDDFIDGKLRERRRAGQESGIGE